MKFSLKYFTGLLFLIVFNSFSLRAQIFVPESSSVGFVIKNMGMNVKGKFTDFKMSGRFNSSDLAGSFLEAEIDVESVDTGTKARDKHLRKPDYFDAAKYPKITFRTEKIVKSETGFEAVGKLKMHGIEKEITIPFSLKKQENLYFLNGKFKVDRTEYGVGEESFVMSDEVKIAIVCALKYD